MIHHDTQSTDRAASTPDLDQQADCASADEALMHATDQARAAYFVNVSAGIVQAWRAGRAAA